MINFTYCKLWRNHNKWTHWFLLSRAFVLSQKEIFINLQAKVVWKPGAIYDFLLRWACVQLYHMIIESTTRSSGSLQLRFILNCDVIFEFSFLNIFKYISYVLGLLAFLSLLDVFNSPYMSTYHVTTAPNFPSPSQIEFRYLRGSGIRY